MTDFSTLVSNTEKVSQLASIALGNYDSLTVIAQSQLGIVSVVENAKLVVAMDIMSDVMKDNEKNEELKITLEANEHKIDCPLTPKELSDYMNSRQIFLSTTLQSNLKIIK